MKRAFNAAQVPQAIALESVQVASPCHADWNAMRGDDRSRFCPSCAKNVYNLSAMTHDEAELLLQEKEGRLCVRFFVREDGTMLTQDCPVGAASLKQRSPSFALWAGVASLLVLVGALVSPSMMTGAHAQPEPHSGTTAAQTTTPTPEAATSPEQAPVHERLGDVLVTPKNSKVQSLGEARIVPSQEIGEKTPSFTMGKPAIPKATPKPKAPPIRMGRIAPPPVHTSHPSIEQVVASPPKNSTKKPKTTSKSKKHS